MYDLFIIPPIESFAHIILLWLIHGNIRIFLFKRGILYEYVYGFRQAAMTHAWFGRVPVRFLVYIKQILYKYILGYKVECNFNKLKVFFQHLFGIPIE